VCTLEGSYIKNTETGAYVKHRADLLHEGGEPEEFLFSADGTITSQDKAVIASQFVYIGDSSGTSWVKVDEAEVDDVPVPRASALIEEALNASSKKCECETCECDPCECVAEPVQEETAVSSPQ
jgi:hypothetical protein